MLDCVRQTAKKSQMRYTLAEIWKKALKCVVNLPQF
jgi:hypothetical protein